MWLTARSLQNPAVTLSLALLFVVLGVWAYARSGVQYVYDPSPPALFVSYRYPGASAATVLTSVVEPIESAISSIEGVRKIRSSAADGGAMFSISFDRLIAFKSGERDVRDRLNQVRAQLPPGLIDVKVQKSGGGDDQVAVEVAFFSDSRTRADVTEYIRFTVLPALAGIAGIAEIRLQGDADRELVVDLRADALVAHGIAVQDVVQALRDNNVDYRGGRLTTAQSDRPVRLTELIRTPDQFAQLVVNQSPRQTVRVADVATVRVSAREPATYMSIDGIPCVSIGVLPLPGSDVVSVSRRVREAIAGLEARLGGDRATYRSKLMVDNASYAQASIRGVERTLLEGALLTVAVVALFLRRTSSVVVSALSIPISVAAAILFTLACGLPINLFTLLAITLSIGVIIDDAIVVRESIDRHREAGLSTRDAAMAGTAIVGRAVGVTTLALLCVLAPLIWTDSPISDFLRQFALATSAAILASWLVSFTVDPCLSAIVPAGRSEKTALSSSEVGPKPARRRVLQTMYETALRACIRRSGMCALIVVFSIVACIALFRSMPVDFIPPADESIVDLMVTLPSDSRLDYLDEKSRQIQAALREFKEVASVFSGIGRGNSRSTLWYFVVLVDPGQRSTSSSDLQSKMTERIERIAGVASSSLSSPIRIDLSGADEQEILSVRESITAEMQKVPGLVQVGYGQRNSEPALHLDFDRERLADLGINFSTFSRAVSILVSGEVVSSWLSPNGREYDIRVGPVQARHLVAGDLDKLEVVVPRSGEISSNAGSEGTGSRTITVPVAYLAKASVKDHARSISRVNSRTVESIFAGVHGRALGDAVADIKKIIRSHERPGIRLTYGAQIEALDDSTKSLKQSVLIGLGTMVMVLFAAFRGPRVALLILLTMPMAVLGALAALYFSHSSLNVFSGIGVLLLMGLMAKNGVLVLDHAERLRLQGRAPEDAIQAGVLARARAVWMTTFATMAGMLPLALGLHSGTDQFQELATVVVVGIFVSTLTTILVLPALYALLASVVQAAGNHRRRVTLKRDSTV